MVFVFPSPYCTYAAFMSLTVNRTGVVLLRLWQGKLHSKKSLRTAVNFPGTWISFDHVLRGKEVDYDAESRGEIHFALCTSLCEGLDAFTLSNILWLVDTLRGRYFSDFGDNASGKLIDIPTIHSCIWTSVGKISDTVFVKNPSFFPYDISTSNQEDKNSQQK